MERAVRAGVEDPRPREVDERVPDSGYLPVDDGRQPRWRLRREEHVVELVVAVAQRERLLGGSVPREPFRDANRGRKVAAPIGRELVEPSGDLVWEVLAAVGQIS